MEKSLMSNLEIDTFIKIQTKNLLRRVDTICDTKFCTGCFYGSRLKFSMQPPIVIIFKDHEKIGIRDY